MAHGTIVLDFPHTFCSIWKGQIRAWAVYWMGNLFYFIKVTLFGFELRNLFINCTWLVQRLRCGDGRHLCSPLGTLFRVWPRIGAILKCRSCHLGLSYQLPWQLFSNGWHCICRTKMTLLLCTKASFLKGKSWAVETWSFSSLERDHIIVFFFASFEAGYGRTCEILQSDLYAPGRFSSLMKH